MSVQHEYRGPGSPVGVVVAPPNSHYLDESTEEAWWCVWSDGETSGWMKVKPDEDVGLISAPWTIAAPINIETLVAGGTLLHFTLDGAVHSNVELTGSRTYTPADACLVQIRRAPSGGVSFIATPVTEYLPPI